MLNWNSIAISILLAVLTQFAAANRPIKLYGVDHGVPVGQVMILHNGQWRYICDDGWDNNDAAVVCRQLGYSYGQSAPHNDRRGLRWFSSNYFWMDDLACSGSENYLDQCSFGYGNGWGSHNCAQNVEEIVVYCGNCTSCSGGTYCWGNYGCHCKLGRYGSGCGGSISSQSDCGIHGIYENVRGGQCTCEQGWTGPQCTVAMFTCPSCANGGTCQGPNKCICPTGWKGSLCDWAECSSACIHGDCTAPDTCTCDSGWTGSTCATPLCTPSCGTHGSCTAPNTCTCNEGWTGATCSDPVPHYPCLNGGTPIGPHRCACPPGWLGIECRGANDDRTRKLTDYKMTGATTLSTVTDVSSSACFQKCIDDGTCKGVNYQVSTANCDLLDKDPGDAGTAVTCDADFNFYSVDGAALPTGKDGRVAVCKPLNAGCIAGGQSCQATCATDTWAGACA